jgi:hypothetical protein
MRRARRPPLVMRVRARAVGGEAPVYVVPRALGADLYYPSRRARSARGARRRLWCCREPRKSAIRQTEQDVWSRHACDRRPRGARGAGRPRARRERVADGDPGDDRSVRRGDPRPAVDPRRPRPRGGGVAVGDDHRPRIPHAVAGAALPAPDRPGSRRLPRHQLRRRPGPVPQRGQDRRPRARGADAADDDPRGTGSSSRSRAIPSRRAWPTPSRSSTPDPGPRPASAPGAPPRAGAPRRARRRDGGCGRAPTPPTGRNLRRCRPRRGAGWPGR